MTNRNIPIFILAGGLGTRISEETQMKAKPMVEIGGIPVLIHLMRYYCSFGFNDFVICGGYRVADIKNYFLNYRYNIHDLEIDTRASMKSSITILSESSMEERWRVRILDTGVPTMTGGRVARALDAIGPLQEFQDFGLTYGDGLCDANLCEEFKFHCEHGATGTVLGVKNFARFGELDVVEGTKVNGFLEKPEFRQGFINGGFFFFKKSFRNDLDTAETLVLERDPLQNLAKRGELRVFKHSGFWYAMDTLRDRNHLQTLWDSRQAPWTVKGGTEEGEGKVQNDNVRVLRRRIG